jgi:hypothetical protein
MNKDTHILVSVSGGLTSGFMAYYIKNKYPNNPKTFVFANTGKEREQTLVFVNNLDKYFNLGIVWLEAKVIHEAGKGTNYKIVDFNTASRNGEPFEEMIKKYGLPNQSRPHCTRELKQAPIHKYIRSITKDYTTAIGIRIDEAHRCNWEKVKTGEFWYPLATEVRATKEFIIKWWDNQDFNLELKSYEGNCDVCWKKSSRKLMTIWLENPHLFDWWVDMETKYGTNEGYTFYRQNQSSVDIIEMAKTTNFSTSICDKDIIYNAPKLFTDLDTEMNCFCGF